MRRLLAAAFLGSGLIASQALAQGNDPEMACVSALADKLAVSMDQISSLGRKIRP